MQLAFQTESLSKLASEHLQGHPQEIYVKICQLQLPRGHCLLMQPEEWYFSARNWGPGPFLASGKKAACLTVSLFPWVGFLPYLQRFYHPASFPHTGLIHFLSTALTQECPAFMRLHPLPHSRRVWATGEKRPSRDIAATPDGGAPA